MSSSLLLAFAVFAAANDYRHLDERLSHGADAASVARQIARDRTSDSFVSEAARQLLTASQSNRKAAVEKLTDLVRLRAAAQGAVDMADADRLRRLAEDTKKSDMYSDPGARQSSNWIGKSLEKLGNINFPQTNVRQGPAVTPIISPYFLIYAVWGILVLTLLFLVYLAIRHFSWKRTLQRKARAMLEADEPERTLDEWLAMAEQLTAEGKFREAVRCLYLACLLRFDEHLVARFDRGQTNWEHLVRIRASSKLPLGLDFEPPTKRFDTIWYGQRTRGMSDVDQFRDWYQRVTKTLAEAKP